MFADYDTVLAGYSEWLVEQRDRVGMVVDVHTAIQERLARERASDPKFTFSGDGIHPNTAGHRVIAETVLKAWGIEHIREPSAELLALATRKTAILHDAWLSHVGHLHPSVKAGPPLAEARTTASKLEAEMAKEIAP